MTPTQISLWVLLLVVQNASFTWVSRARNSGSDWYHATAAVFSNGVWFAAFFYTFAGIEIIRESGNPVMAVGLGLLYVVATVTGSVSAGMLLRKYVERGKRKVGHYEKEIALDVKNSNAIRDLQRVVGEYAARQQSLIDGGLDRLWAERARSVPDEEATPNPDVPMFSSADLPGPDLQEYMRERDARERKYD